MEIQILIKKSIIFKNKQQNHKNIVRINNFGIKSALVLETGLTANEVFKDNQINEQKLRELLEKYNAICNFFIKKVASV